MTTERGTTYAFDTRADAAPTVTRYPAPGAPTCPGDLRPLRLLSRQSPRATRGADYSILLGDRMLLVTEPIEPNAEYSARMTSPVTAIDRRDP
ncbi:hypothetical protein [Cellulomonas septica]|uniref:Uncharacterized protein n=1 Tax=Cellulomonas septica TaxID=285080 RepID=A0ABX1JV17_9CELL|nr:hypothetical protein [Cellulomonas septica]NKY38156.1 hypothetical protein [Cellulomonas septica]